MTFRKLPPAAEAYDLSQSLPDWMEANRKRFGDIYQSSIYGGIAYVVSAPEYAEHVLRRNWKSYKKGSAITRVALLLGKGLMVSEGKLWKNQRRMIQPAFHHKLIAGTTNVIVDANAALLKRWERAAGRAESVNLTRDISLMTLDILLRIIFGENYEECAPHFSMLSDETVRDFKFARSFRSLGSLILQIANRRRQCGRLSPDLLSLLLEARDPDDGQPMPDSRLIDEILTLVVAGHETTASTLNWMWYLLSQSPDVEDKLRAELRSEPELPCFGSASRFAYGRQVIEETLRLYPAGWLMTRRALRDDLIGGYFVPAGVEIYLPSYIIQRHPNLWHDPDRFDPDRFNPDQSAARHPLTTLPFSAGPRNCIGEPLAWLEMQMHLALIANSLRLEYLESNRLELDFGVNLRNRYDFLMKPVAVPASAL